MAMLPFRRCLFVGAKVIQASVTLKRDSGSLSFKEDTPQKSFRLVEQGYP